MGGDPMHGYMALVVPVLRGDARYALKVSWIDHETVNEAAALALWDGGGAVRLLDADEEAGALLLEWLDPRRRLDAAAEAAAWLAPRAGGLLALVDEAGLDAELARGWTLLRAVDYQLWALRLGLTEDPARCATVIDWLSLAGGP